MRSKWVQVPGAFILLVLAGWFIYAMIHAGPAVQSGILAMIGVVSAGIIANVSAKKREIEARHFNEKREGYKAFVDMIFDSLMAEKRGKKPPTERQMREKIIEYKKMLLIWADSDVIKTWNKFEIKGINKIDNEATLKLWDELLRAMRKDLGKDDSQFKKGELFSLLLTSEDKDKVKQGSF
ncbi:MAG: hypothetical protein OXC84_04330 [Gammaproteobacteria bacterium]|nr:hypothetical protein [Gammaproteobacteria bacterium]